MKTIKSNLRKATAIALTILMIVPMLVLPSFALANETAAPVLFEQNFDSAATLADVLSRRPSLATLETDGTNKYAKFKMEIDKSGEKMYWLFGSSSVLDYGVTYDAETKKATTSKYGTLDVNVTGASGDLIGTVTTSAGDAKIYYTYKDVCYFVCSGNGGDNIEYGQVDITSAGLATTMGTVLIEAKYYLSADLNYSFQIKDSGTDLLHINADGSLGKISNGGTITNKFSMTKGAWHLVQIYYNTATKVYDVYVDYQLAYGGATFKGNNLLNGKLTLFAIPRQASTAGLTTAAGLKGYVLVDDVKITDTALETAVFSDYTAKYTNSMVHSLYAKEGEKTFLRLPFLGTVPSSSWSGGAHDNNVKLAEILAHADYQYDPATGTYTIPKKDGKGYEVGNTDKTVQYNNVAIAYKENGLAELTLSVRPHYGSKSGESTMQMQFKGNTGLKNECGLFNLTVGKAGTKIKLLNGGDGMGGTTVATIANDMWTAVRVLIDQTTGKYYVYADNVWVGAGTLNATNITIDAGKLLLAKVKRDTGNKMDLYTDICNYIDYADVEMKDVTGSATVPTGMLASEAYAATPNVFSFRNDAEVGDYLHVPFVKSNIDVNPKIKHDAITSGKFIVVDTDYYIPATDRAYTTQMQFMEIKNGDAKKWFSDLFQIELNTGKVKRETGVELGTIAHDKWNNIKLVIDRENATYSVYINGKLTATKQAVSLAEKNFTVSANSLVVAKLNKTGIQWENGACTDPNIPETEQEGMPYVDFKFNSITVTDNTFNMADYSGIITSVEGASVRLDENSGLRFATYIDQAKIDAIAQLVEAGEIKSFKIGTLITLESYKTAAGGIGTKKALDALAKTGNGGKTYIDVVAEYNVWFNHTKAGLTVGEGQAVFAGTISNIKTNHYDAAMYGVGYVEVTLLSGETVVLYGTGYTASVKEKAQGILNGDTTGYTTEELAILNTFAGTAGN